MEDKERTLFCGNLSDKVTENILYELFLQAGPLESVTIPKDKDGRQRNFAFITFKHAVSVPYTVALMNGISLYGKAISLKPRTGALAEHNPYLEQLEQYRISVSQRNSVNYGYNQPDSRRYEQRFEGENCDYNKWNMYPVPTMSYPQFNPYGSPDISSQRGMVPNTMTPPPSISYPVNHYNRNQKPWSGRRH